MSELIVEMEMPENCVSCPMAHWNKVNELTGCDAVSGKRYISMDDKFWNTERPSWCPIKGVLPETHGRLIDEAVFCENVVKYSHQSTKTIGKALDATPTIIDMTLIDTERSET